MNIEMNPRITLYVDNEQAERAIRLVREFLLKYPDNHRAKRPEYHGVGFRFEDADCDRRFFVYGDPHHVRVKQDPSTNKGN